MKKKTRCYIYTRVSTAIQVDGYSLDAQKDKLRKYAEFQDMEIVGEYSDEGHSGKNIKGRQEFMRMLNDIEDGKDGVDFVLVFKLSRFGRNAADVLSSLQLMQDYGVNLICVEDGIDSSKEAGKLLISIIAAVAEMERENIRVQTMAGREQKAREGKWNGGFAPYGYKLENGELVIAEDEVEIIQMIFDRYIHTNDGINGVANYLNNHGYTKKLRQNGTIPGFSSSFIKKIIDNPVYMGKIAYGRRRTEKKTGTRNETHVVEQSEFPVYEGIHEAIISEEDWNLAQEKRSKNNYRREKIHDPEHAHILSGILKCPCCGKGMYGNIAKAGRKDKKTRYYYYCKNTVNATGHKCTFRCNIEQSQIDDVLAKLITAMTREGKFKDAIQDRIGATVDTSDLEKQLSVLNANLHQAETIKTRLEQQMDNLDVTEVIVPVLCEGRGTVRCQHGILPIPVPAVANIVSANHLHLKMTEVEGELVTPTGAAIVAAVKTKDKLPETFEIQKIGIGAGKRQYECPGILRAMIISQSAETDEAKAQTEEFKHPEIGNNPKAENQETKDTIIKMETNIDDCSGEVLGFVMERLMKAGARDVHYVPVFMKKNRPAWVLNVICKEEDMEMLQNIIFEETTTIGIRYSRMERTILPRETRTLPTPWGEVQVKVCTLNGKEQLYPEYESVAQLSREKEIPFTEIYRYIVLANKEK